MKSIKLKFIGTHPLMMSADVLANPLDDRTKEHKRVSNKRKKSDDDHRWLMRSEFMAGMYHDEKLGPFIPGQNIDACLIEGAKQKRLGKAFGQAVLCIDDKCKLEYDGPRDPTQLYDSHDHRDVRSCVVSNRRVMRCRPLFRDWKLTCTVSYNETVIDEDQVIEAARTAGELVGLGTFRRRFGRFEVEVPA